MSTPQSTPVKQAKLGLVSAKTQPLANEYKKLFAEQHQRLTTKHQQDLDLIDDIRSYVKARLNIERDYTQALNKLARHHSSHIAKKFTLLSQCSGAKLSPQSNQVNSSTSSASKSANDLDDVDVNVSSLENRLANKNNQDVPPNKSCTLYKVWSEHINRLQSTSKNRSDQFEQLIMIVDKLKDIRSHKASVGKKCLDAHIKRVHEDLLISLIELERARKLYYEDESQAKKARENEEKFKKKRSGLLTKFTDLQAKKEKSSAQREATDIQSTQARNDYIMALAAANAHLANYYQRDLNDFTQLIDDNVLDHCKVFMATLSECELNSLKDTLSNAQYWSKLINLSGSQQTNLIFFECDQSKCLRSKQVLAFEPCNNDSIRQISLEHNADYALQHEIDKWFTWFKKECRNLSQLVSQLDACQLAFSEGRKNVELNGQTVDDLEGKIIELKQLIRKSEAAKLKAQARLKVIKEGGMQIEEWDSVEAEIRADIARAQEEAARAKRPPPTSEEDDNKADEQQRLLVAGGGYSGGSTRSRNKAPDVKLQSASGDLDDGDDYENACNESGLGAAAGDENGGSMQNLASVSRSTSNLAQKQQSAISGYTALTDPSLVWKDDYSSAWGAQPATSGSGVVVTTSTTTQQSELESGTAQETSVGGGQYDLLGAGKKPNPSTSMSIQSSSPLSAIVNGGQHLSQSPYQNMMSEAYKSDYECDYTRTAAGQSMMMMRSSASSAEPNNTNSTALANHYQQPAGVEADLDEAAEYQTEDCNENQQESTDTPLGWLNKRVVALYSYEKTNEDDLAFNEGDCLLVVEVNEADVNWLKAQSEFSGETGYIPSSYVRLQGENDAELAYTDKQLDGGHFGDATSMEPTRVAASGEEAEFDDQQEEDQQQHLYCKALYDYKPDENTYEEDGLPHIALVQGELMRVIDQGEDDGWWLVEKQIGGLRGHVPSMLVEELEYDDVVADTLNENGNGEEAGGVQSEELDEFDDDECNGSDDDSGERIAPPNFEPPVLGAKTEEHVPVDAETTNSELPREELAASGEKQQQSSASSLQPRTSFIIIEPTPDVESRRFEPVEADATEAAADKTEEAQKEAAGASDSSSPTGQIDNQCDGVEQRCVIASGGGSDVRQISVATKLPPADASYSVVNENFVLERPTRKPSHPNSGSDANGKETTPTILEESVAPEEEEEEKSRPTNGTCEHNLASNNVFATDSGGDGDGDGANNYGSQSKVDSADIPVPPSVVIDSCADISRSDDDDEDEEQNGADDEPASSASSKKCNDNSDGGAESTSSADQQQQQQLQKRYVDVSPIIRYRADEFSRQIIDEAIMLAPGTNIGPSTSSPLVVSDGNETDEYENNGANLHSYADDDDDDDYEAG